jgi:hypothetical protein
MIEWISQRPRLDFSLRVLAFCLCAWGSVHFAHADPIAAFTDGVFAIIFLFTIHSFLQGS